ncbi:hypothetical protein IMCC3317_11530 [Kordia antarctica]|uniref:Uncharacterized protein n=1 Tax=Kordia antarctica TaxID=1218801 RepID=A0A7L4ZGN5_9FLAO|nr:hypothetical protein [Kordia antarctica]QHI35805.1 hypothetical protein IMCC3317_11530 [Kordia antarctica]
MKSLKLFIYILVLCCLAACSFGTETKVHNQLDTTLIIEINEETYTLKPNKSVEVSYTYGENRIKSTSNNQVIVDTVVTITREMTEDGALINATGKPYYIMTEKYGGSILDNPIYDRMIAADSSTQNDKFFADYKEKKRERMMENMKIVVIDSIPIIGNIETIPANQIVISRDWYYGLNANFEETIESNDASDSFFGKSVKKIFSEKKLLEYWYQQE